MLTKIDILNREFGRTFRGYDRAEVDQAVQEAAEAIGSLTEERNDLKARVEDLEKALAEHKSREETLRATLVTTQKMIDDMKATAQKEAQLIVDAANSKADNMLNQAHMRLAQIHEDISELKKQRTQFEVKLRSILDAHMSLLEMDKEEREALEESEDKLKFIRRAGG
jgi:cell division initiation protein